MTLTPLRDILEVLTFVVAIVGVPVGLYKYFQEKRRERIARDKEAFAISNQRYVEYLQVCLDHPELDAFDLPQSSVGASTTEYKRTILFSALTAMLETAYMFYGRGVQGEIPKQWGAWDRYLRLWAKRADYRSVWDHLKPQFHDEFVEYMDSLMRKPVGDDGSRERKGMEKPRG